MAALVSSSSSPNSPSSVIVNCSVCNRRFASKGGQLPKLLPTCFHTLCVDCISTSLKQSSNLVCPICSTKNGSKLPSTGPEGLQNNFLILDALPLLDSKTSGGVNCDCCDEPELSVLHCSSCSQYLCEFHVSDHQKRRQTKDHPLVKIEDLRASVSVPHRPLLCQQHEKELEMFCERCDKLVCTTCALLDHREHSLLTIQDAAKNEAGLQQYIEQAKERLSTLKATVSSTRESERRMRDRANECRADINKGIDEAIKLLEARRTQLLLSVDQIEKEKAEGIINKTEHVQLALAAIEGSCCFAEKVLTTTPSSAQVLLTKSLLCEKLKECRKAAYSAFSITNIQIDDEYEHIVFTMTLEQLQSQINCLGNIISQVVDPQKSTISGSGHERAVVGHASEFIVTTRDANGKPVSNAGEVVKVTAVWIAGNSRSDPGSPDGLHSGLSPRYSLAPVSKHIEIKAKVEDRKDGTYGVKYTLTADGVWSLHVTVKGAPIPNSPFSVTAVAGRDYTSIKLNTTCLVGSSGNGSGQLKYPEGIVLDGSGLVYVADRNNKRIEIFRARDGAFVRQFPVAAQPRGLAVDHKGYLVVVCSDNIIRIYTPEGRSHSHFGSRGHNPGQFSHPWGVAIDRHRQIYIADYSNHCVQVFSPDGNFKTSLGQGAVVSQPNGPIGVTLNSAGEIIVTDLYNHCVHIYSNDGTLIKSFGSKGNGTSQFNSPTGVAVDSQDNIIVCDEYNNRIQVFDPVGNFLHAFGSKGAGNGQFDGPRWIDVDSEGRLYITESINHRFQVI